MAPRFRSDRRPATLPTPFWVKLRRAAMPDLRGWRCRSDCRSRARRDDVGAAFPAGWQPDLVALWLNYTGVPDCLWSAPVPIVGLATDWNLLWHEYRQVLPFCDAVLTDEPGVDVLARAGIGRARPAVLYGAAPDSLGRSNTAERDIDVLFVGNLHPAVQRERLPWLARLAKLAERRNVVISNGNLGR